MSPSKTTSVLIALVVAAFLAVMIASSLGASEPATHVMPSGEAMDGTTMPE